jgi:hypothetical protein
MSDLHTWEEVYSSRASIGGFADVINRFSVPGGWIYIHANMQKRWFFPDKWTISTVFVPDPERR